MNKHMIITIIITIMIGIVCMLYGLSLLMAVSAFSSTMGFIFVLMVIAAMAGIIYAIFHNMNERFREIKEEKNDDLSKY